MHGELDCGGRPRGQFCALQQQVGALSGVCNVLHIPYVLRIVSGWHPLLISSVNFPNVSAAKGVRLGIAVVFLMNII